MKILGNRVLIEQTEIIKDTKIIQLDKNKRDNYIVTFKVLQLGTECPTGPNELAVGDKPIMSSNVTYEGIKVISEEKDPITKLVKKTVVNAIVYYEDIVGAE